MSLTYFAKILFLASLVTCLSCSCTSKENHSNTGTKPVASEIVASSQERDPSSTNPLSPNNTVSPSNKVSSNPSPSPHSGSNYDTSTLKTPTISSNLPSSIPQSSSTKSQVQATFPILYYHAVSDDIQGMAELFVSPQEFRAQMNYLKKNNYDVIRFADIKNIQRYKKPIIISFDDGYKNNFLEAYPILKENNFSASIFIATDFIDKTNYLTRDDIKNMCDLIQFESHSVSHPDLTKLSKDALELEYSESQKIIEALTGQKSTSFAYPSGYFNHQVMDVLKKYYSYAVTTQSGLYNTHSDNYQIKRVYVPRGTTLPKFEKRLSKGSL